MIPALDTRHQLGNILGVVPAHENSWAQRCARGVQRRRQLLALTRWPCHKVCHTAQSDWHKLTDNQIPIMQKTLN